MVCFILGKIYDGWFSYFVRLVSYFVSNEPLGFDSYSLRMARFDSYSV